MVRDGFGKVCAPVKAALGLWAAIPAVKSGARPCVSPGADIDTEDINSARKNYSTHLTGKSLQIGQPPSWIDIGFASRCLRSNQDLRSRLPPRLVLRINQPFLLQQRTGSDRVQGLHIIKSGRGRAYQA